MPVEVITALVPCRKCGRSQKASCANSVVERPLTRVGVPARHEGTSRVSQPNPRDQMRRRNRCQDGMAMLRPRYKNRALVPPARSARQQEGEKRKFAINASSSEMPACRLVVER